MSGNSWVITQQKEKLMHKTVRPLEDEKTGEPHFSNWLTSRLKLFAALPRIWQLLPYF